jgi:hypothetical protein
MLKTTIAFIGLVGIMIACLGCAEAPSRLGAHYGESVQQALSNQILHPEASKNLGPQEGLDGQAAEIVMDEYRKTFKCKEKKQPVIGIFGGG